jgi:ribonuclease HI
MKLHKLIIHSDGGARGNPGPSGIGYVISDGEKKIFENNTYLGIGTNNQAEYQALNMALEYVVGNDLILEQLFCYLDSELVVKQLNGHYKIKDSILQKLALEIFTKLKVIKDRGCLNISIIHILRSENKSADKLANLAMDKGCSSDSRSDY